MKKNDWVPKLEDCPPSLLRTLVAFADQGSVSKAAAALGVEQPAVSRRLRVFLGRRGGEALLERVSAKRLRLTERGEDLLPAVREVLSRYDELLAHLRGRQQSREVVRLALGSYAAQLYLPHVLAGALRQERWRLEARVVRGQERIRGVAEGRFDLALVTHAPDDVARLASGRVPLRLDLLARHAVVVLAHPDTPAGGELRALPAGRAVPPEKLARWPLVGLDEQAGLRRRLQQHLHGRAQLRHALEGVPGGWTLAREYARHRLGATLLPLPLVTRQDREDFIMRPLSSSFRIEVYLLGREGERTPGQKETGKLLQQASEAVMREARA